MRKVSYLSICAIMLFLISCRKEDRELCTQAQFSKVYGGSDEDGAYSILSTADAGYLFAGITRSDDGDVSGYHGQGDGWIVKLNCNGKIQWQRTFGGSAFDEANHAIIASDGGYILGGHAYSNDGDLSGNHGEGDIWVLKLDLNGNKVWQKLFGGSGQDLLTNIVATPDGGYILLAATRSNDGDIIGHLGSFDAWLIKIDKNGNKLWQKVLGGIDYDWPTDIVATFDGGYLLVGETYVDQRRSYDGWIMKLGANWNQSWQKTFGGSQLDAFGSIINTPDGKYLVSGTTFSNDGDVIGKQGGTEVNNSWFVKFEEDGAMVWQKTVGEAGVNYGITSIINVPGGGYGGAGTISGVHDALLMKLDGNGNKVWQKRFGGSQGDYFTRIIPNPGRGYVMAGATYSNDGDISGNHGGEDAWVFVINGEL